MWKPGTATSGLLSNILAAATVFCNLLPAAAGVTVKVLEAGNDDEISQRSYRMGKKSCRQRNSSGTSFYFINCLVLESEPATSVLKSSFSLSEGK